ncbi:uncharacterized protein DUF4835 [Gillisia mitskevichiae]|uniref:Uncharacterized protein DUF4835 n=1 Tax=Gillisia mitskevichiae TaxID=270921 RepID=A0A495PMQ4_9FLAO|nr:DUF4835 family protein [Gillisia mitskevichiae]RKS50758.1 uncharacterized protein DUF4835 [Gillisia mitskevichiae]
MSKLILVLSLFFCLSSMTAQELNCEVIVNAEQTGQSNLTVFKTLQTSLSEFINKTTWTGTTYQNQERINCSIFINISSFDNETFTGTIQVQSSRPIFGSSLISPVFNFNDEQFTFTYREFEPLNYSENAYSSNLVSVISYYVYTILGLDADTFELEGGTPFYEEANRIVTTAQQGNSAGWKGSDGTRSRYRLNADLLSNAFLGYRTTLYQYHRLGLDTMHKDVSKGKQAITASILNIKKMNESRPNSLLMRVFFDAKAQEIEQVFSGGPSVPVTELKEALNRIAPLYAENWSKIQF